LKKTIYGTALGLLSLGISLAWAGNEGLALPQQVPAGERVANYLQAYWAKIGALVEAKTGGDILGGFQTYKVVVDYDPEKKVLEVSLVGMSRDKKIAQQMLEAVKQIILKLNPKIEKRFGVTLQEGDLSMEYLYAKSGETLLRYQDGHFVEGPVYTPTPEPMRPLEDFSP
jgi:hypothetical protein